MKNSFLLLLILPSISFCQIEIDNEPEKKITAIPYDGSFAKFDYSVKDDVAAGMIGEKVTLLDVSTFDVKKENGDRVSYSDDDNFKNKTYEIIAYEKDIYPTFTIKSDLGTYKWKVSSTSKYVFNKYLEVIQEKLLDKVYIPLYNQREVEALDGSKLILNGSGNIKSQKYLLQNFL